MPRRRSHFARNFLLLSGLVIFLLMGVSPLFESMLPYESNVARWLEWIRSRVMEAIVALWFFAFGSMVGSFINVVVWRMPRGVSVVSRGSACPWCTNKIQLKDNIPIFGWIKLRGRCRVCRLPISPRYPIVEAIFGIVFLLLFYVELQSACSNLPGGKRYLSSGILQVVISTKPDVVVIWAYHTLLMVMLMIWSLMAFDRSRIPIKTTLFTLVIGLAGAISLPYLQPMKWHGAEVVWFAGLPVLDRAATAFLGIVAGFFIGSIIESMISRPNANRDNRLALESTGLLVSWASIGLFLGWQATFWILLLFGILYASRAQFVRLRWLPVCSLLALATLVFLSTWVCLHPTKLDETGWIEKLLAASLGLLLCWLATYFTANSNEHVVAVNEDVE